MTVNKTPEIIALTSQVGKRDGQPQKAGRRMLIKDNSGNGIQVTEGVFDNHTFCKQEFKKDAVSHRWKEYLRDGVKATGALTEDGSLIWFPTKGTVLVTQDLERIVGGMCPGIPILAAFRFGEKPNLTRHNAEISITSRAEAYDPMALNLADYFVRSIGESEENLLRIHMGGETSPRISGSTHEYVRYLRPQT